MRRLIALLVLAQPISASAQLAIELCANDADDDGDALIDCADTDCERDARCLGELEVRVGSMPIEDPRRYPQSYVDQPLTYLQGMLVPALGVSARDDFAIPDPHVHLGVGLTYAIYDFWEISILPLPVRVSPRAAYEDPAISTTLRLLEHEVVEVGVYGNLAIPVTQDEGEAERLPTEHLLARSRSGDSAELDLGIAVRLHLARIARLDLFAPVVTLVFSAPEVRVDVAIPIRVAFQITPFAYAGVWSGVILPGPDYGSPKIPAGFVVGTSIPGARRGPLLDAAIRLGWPELWDPARIGDEVSGHGWQITIEARVLTYLLP